MELSNKRVLLGVSGSIAAYKSAELVRLLRKQGAEVRVVMTSTATEFIQPLTFQALSGNIVYSAWDDADRGDGMGHIELARWADVIVVAPASADLLARLRQGMANDLLTTLCLASASTIAVAPAMNRLMWDNAATKENLAVLKQRGIHVLGPGAGGQACGEVGLGRMLEPEQLVQGISGLFSSGILSGAKLLLTAGPTREPIDAMRFLSNRSSGKMGYALAQAAIEAGADVTLVSGPVALATPDRVKRLDVNSADEMYEAVMSEVAGSDVFICAAAVADYKPANPSKEKVKRKDNNVDLALTQNRDIVASVTALPDKPFTVGFAAETSDIEAHARAKLKRKGLDLIAANQVGDGQGAEVDENAMTLYWADGSQHLEKTSKAKLARQMVTIIGEHYRATTRT
ncbi:MAG: bifunctional phosphopantothenoylcysteine decarboxylase/phosphopantothenate--cysteine ligase CoaBC [Gammaproteobacteria bacterium]|nr:MAG: bifunctional phosphopantothenoylcysteine decarboxylase/phosphopantothenate--cysteine ligase CoaBC [Gammaproteobacteria bacterium]